MADSNSLGLDFEKETTTEQTTTEKSDKKKPYVNPERVKTGGPQREKLTEEELAERMQRMKEQNAKIKQRREDVKADEEAFREMQEADRAKLAQARKMQDGIDRTREQNARRKMEKMESREWDSGKGPSGERKTEQRGGKPVRGVRGGPRGRGHGRGGRGGTTPDIEPAPTAATATATTTTTTTE